MQEGEEVGYDALYRVGHIHLVAVELDAILLQVDVALDLGEVEHTGEVEGVVYIEVNPEQRLIAHGVEVAVELLVVLVGEFARSTCPQGVGVVDDVVLIGLHLLAILPILLLAEGDRDGEETAVLGEQ